MKPDKDKSPLINLREVAFRYREEDPRVIQDLSLDIKQGEVTAILGPNGTGKTTLLHLMLGLLKPLRGEVLVDGRPHHQLSRRRLSQTMGLVPQFESIPFNFSVFEYVLLGRSPYLKPFQLPTPEDREIACQALESAGILHLAEKPVTEISGGERQLCHLSRALAQQTRVLLLDEPTAHLDLENQHRILNLLIEMADRGMAIVLTTHDPNAAVYAADTFVLINEGDIFAEGNLEQVITAENLSALYQVPLRVERSNGHTLVVMENA